MLVLLLAVIPNAIYLEHWPLLGVVSVNTEEESEDHAAHCHGGPAGCADQSGAQSVVHVPGAIEIAFAGVFIAVLAAVGIGRVRALNARIEKPPRTTFAFAT